MASRSFWVNHPMRTRSPMAITHLGTVEGIALACWVNHSSMDPFLGAPRQLIPSLEPSSPNFHTPFRDASSVILEPENQKCAAKTSLYQKRTSHVPLLSQQALSVVRTALLARILPLLQCQLQSKPTLRSNFDSTPWTVEGICSIVSGNPNILIQLSP